MKKQSILLNSIILLCVTVCSAATVYTAAQNKKEIENTFTEKEVLVQEESTLYKTCNSAPVFGAEKLSDDAVLTALNKSGKTKTEIYNDIFSYKKFIETYNISAKNLKYIDLLLTRGADIEKIIEIYCFWTTTSEDISIIGDIYDMSENAVGAYWIEEAFNFLTEDRHGVLTKEEISNYMAKNLTADDIQIANILSRKGVMTITEILDSYNTKRQWSLIISEIYEVSESDTEKTSAIEAIATPADLLRFIFMENSTQGIVGEINSETVENFNNEVNSKVNSELFAKGIFLRDDEIMGKEASDSLKSKIYENGLTQTDVDNLLDKGYKLIDIVNISSEMKGQPAEIDAVLNQKQMDRMSERSVISE